MRPAALLAVPIATLALASGCGSSSSTTRGPDRPPAKGATGYFVGTASDGVGASLDLVGSDGVARALRAALAGERGRDGRPPAVGIASVVNTGTAAAPTPSFVAVLSSGEAVPMAPARAALGRRDDRAARRARAMLPRPRRAVAARGSAVVYLVLPDASPQEVAWVTMTSRAGHPITLAPRPR